MSILPLVPLPVLYSPAHLFWVVKLFWVSKTIPVPVRLFRSKSPVKHHHPVFQPAIHPRQDQPFIVPDGTKIEKHISFARARWPHAHRLGMFAVVRVTQKKDTRAPLIHRRSALNDTPPGPGAIGVGTVHSLRCTYGAVFIVPLRCGPVAQS